MQTKPTNYHG